MGHNSLADNTGLSLFV